MDNIESKQMRDQYKRMLLIDKAVRNDFKKYPSKDELKELCAVADVLPSDSTIEKDLKQINTIYKEGFKSDEDVIKYNRLHKGYEYVDKDFSLSKSENLVNENQLEAIKLSAATLKQYSYLPFIQEFEVAMDKIFDSVYASEYRGGADYAAYMEFESTTDSGGTEYLTQLLSAIKEQSNLEVQYYSRSSEKVKDYVLRPYYLKQYRGHWYCLAYDCKAKLTKNFALSRIRKFTTTDTVYPKIPAFNAGDFFKYALGIYVYDDKEPEFICLKFPTRYLPYIENWAVHKEQFVDEKKEDYFILKFWSYVGPDLHEKIFSYMPFVEVLEPLSLREEIAKQLAEALQKHTT